MKATHVVITNEKHYLERGERVYVSKATLPILDSRMVWVQSVNPSCGDGLWITRVSNLKPISKNLENK